MINTTLEKQAVAEPLEPSKIELISIRSLFPARLKYTGRESGKLYEWAEAGSVVEVHAEDVPYLLSKKLGKGGCCGASKEPNKLFEQI